MTPENTHAKRRATRREHDDFIGRLEGYLTTGVTLDHIWVTCRHVICYPFPIYLFSTLFMSNTTHRLFCFIKDDSTTFSVDVPSTALISKLRKINKAENEIFFSKGLTPQAPGLVLWKVHYI